MRKPICQIICQTIMFLCLMMLVGCGKSEVQFTGQTMGTTYHIKVVAGTFQRTAFLKKKIDDRLKEINLSMSTYLKDSEISKFNAMTDTGRRFYMSDDFAQVITIADNIYGVSQGAWDGTVNPLVNLWGFGKVKREGFPSPEEVRAVLSLVGFRNYIEFDDHSKSLQKRHPNVTLDLGSIAKGYGVDQIAELIDKNGFKNYIVEIGGEIYASGVKADGNFWRVGVNTPKAEAGLNDVYKVLKLQDKAMATSGDYRNFFEEKGQRFSHIIDPKTGYPVNNGVVSVSVMADNCTFADGLATALMVIGPEKGIPLINNLKDVECFFIVQGNDGNLKAYASTGFNVENP